MVEISRIDFWFFELIKTDKSLGRPTKERERRKDTNYEYQE